MADVRTSSVAYDPADTSDRACHLVNDAVQSQFDSYSKFEDCNKLSFEELQAVLDSQPLDDGRVLSVEDDLWPGMRTTISHVFRCALSSLSGAPPSGAMFELFGLDFMVDADGRVLLIEVSARIAQRRSCEGRLALASSLLHSARLAPLTSLKASPALSTHSRPTAAALSPLSTAPSPLALSCALFNLH